MTESFRWTLSRGVAYSSDRFYVLAYSAREEGARVFRWTGRWDNYYVACKTAGICAKSHPRPEILTLCVGGEIHSAGPDGQSITSLSTNGEEPVERGVLRDIRVVGDDVYVVGLGRQVFRRQGDGPWIRIDFDVIQSKGSEEIAGFESVDGFGSNEVYAVGMGGDIWLFDSQVWRKIDGATNLILSKVLCAPDGKVYIGGQLGTLIEGRGAAWQLIGLEFTTETIWDLAWFDGALWISTIAGLYRYFRGGFEVVEVGLGGNPSYRYLSATTDTLWSIGSDDLLVYQSGEWSQVPKP